MLGDCSLLTVDPTPDGDRIDAVAVLGQDVTDVGPDGVNISIDAEFFCIYPWYGNTDLRRGVAPLICFPPQAMGLGG